MNSWIKSCIAAIDLVQRSKIYFPSYQIAFGVQLPYYFYKTPKRAFPPICRILRRFSTIIKFNIKLVGNDVWRKSLCAVKLTFTCSCQIIMCVQAAISPSYQGRDAPLAIILFIKSHTVFLFPWVCKRFPQGMLHDSLCMKHTNKHCMHDVFI